MPDHSILLLYPYGDLYEIWMPRVVWGPYCITDLYGIRLVRYVLDPYESHVYGIHIGSV